MLRVPAMVPNPHDRLFKETFSRPEHAAALLRSSLPPTVLEHLDLGSLTLEPGSHVDGTLRERFTDLLFSARLSGREAYVYLLLEHKSTSEALTILYMARYVVDVLCEHVKNHAGTTLPAVIPLLVHHGAGGWRAATKLHALYDVPSEAQEAVGRYLLGLECVLDDISRQSDDRLRQRSMDALPTLALWLMRQAQSGADVMAELPRVVDLFHQVLGAESGVQALSAVVSYMMRIIDGPPEVIDIFLTEEVEPRAHEAYMTAADILQKEAYDKGLDAGVEGWRSTLLLLLEERFGALPAGAKRRVDKARPGELEVWTQAILRAASLEELFGAGS